MRSHQTLVGSRVGAQPHDIIHEQEPSPKLLDELVHPAPNTRNY